MAARDITRYEQRLLVERSRLLKASPPPSPEELTKVDAALRRLYSDPMRFGRCLACGLLISWGVIDANPTTQYCAKHSEADCLV